VTEPTAVPKVAITEQPVEKVIATPANLQKEAVYVQANSIIETTKISFKFNSNQTVNSEDSKIKALSDILKATPDMSLRIVGHTCNLGSRKINEQIGLKRAIVVKQRFTDQGVSDSQLHVESKSFDDPLVPNTSRKNRIQNRRVTLIVINDPLVSPVPAGPARP